MSNTRNGVKNKKFRMLQRKTSRNLRIIQLISFALFISHFCAAQDKYRTMKSSTTFLTKCLRNDDTIEIFKMLDTTFNHIKKINYKDILETIGDECLFFKTITKKYGQPDSTKIRFMKDSVSGANIALLPLMKKKDTTLNIEEGNLVVFFYPDSFFNFKPNQILNFYIQKKIIKTTIKAPIEQIHQSDKKNYP
jgi:hypothetical protein